MRRICIHADWISIYVNNITKIVISRFWLKLTQECIFIKQKTYIKLILQHGKTGQWENLNRICRYIAYVGVCWETRPSTFEECIKIHTGS